MDPREALVERDKKYIWHPYTPMEAYLREGKPLVIARASGARFYDMDGRSFIDGNASWWTSLLGHNHPRLVAALKEQAELFCHTSIAGITHEPAIEIAERLVSVAPEGLNHVFFSDNGSTAVESALKLSAQYWYQIGKEEKSHFLALEHAFHGETLGVTALGGVAAFRQPFSRLTMPTTHLPSPADDLDRAVSELERVLSSEARSIAALVIEPLIQGAGGMRVYPPEYLRVARTLTERYGVHLIVDEVFTGYGRTGRFWASDHAEIQPDIIATAKGLSGGLLPFAATLIQDHVFRGFLGDSSRAFYYGHTYCGNPLGARVAAEVLRVYEEEKILERAQESSRILASCFDALSTIPGVSNVRHLGMCAAFDLSQNAHYLETLGWRVYEAALRRGAYVRPLGNVVYLTPPLNIPREDLEELCSIVSASVQEVLAETA